MKWVIYMCKRDRDRVVTNVHLYKGRQWWKTSRIGEKNRVGEKKPKQEPRNVDGISIRENHQPWVQHDLRDKCKRNLSVPFLQIKKKGRTYGDQYMTPNHKWERDNQRPIPTWDLPVKRYNVRCEDNHHGDTREANHKRQLETFPDARHYTWGKRFSSQQGDDPRWSEKRG